MNRYRKQIVFFCDAALFGLSVGFYLLVLYFLPNAEIGASSGLASNLALLYGCTVLFQMIFKTYDSLWRYAESKEYLTLLEAAICGFALYEVATRIILRSSISFILLAAIASLWVLGMLSIRFAYRVFRNYRFRSDQRGAVPLAIVGAGEAGVKLLDDLQHGGHYRPVCFFDDDPQKQNKYIHGVPIKGTISEALSRMKAMDIREVVVAIPTLDEDRRREVLAQLADKRVHVSILPSTLELIDQKPMRTQLREVKIEDLLFREQVQLDHKVVDAFLMDKVVMVTGGGGSIGSELCRQIVKHRPRQLVIVDIYENNAYDIQQELRYYYGDQLNLEVEIASIRDAERVRQIFCTYRPDVVFHAAAHKHVPLMERNPQEAIRNNVFGTLNLVRAAEEFGVEKFIQISTDKAVNPTSVMGASKRLCEMILQSRKGQGGKTTFAAVRFGNVLGSNGSVVPLFKRQIAAGGPVTITDKRIIRYFMTIPEAAQLVLHCGAMAHQNELYVLDMGRPVKILDLAENLIRLSGLVPYQDIDIVETGLRPGEKLYEELLIGSRDIEKTENDKIFIERQPAITPEELADKLAMLTEALAANDPAVIRDAMHQVVPSFHEPEELNQEQGEEVRIPAQTI